MSACDIKTYVSPLFRAQVNLGLAKSTYQYFGGGSQSHHVILEMRDKFVILYCALLLCRPFSLRLQALNDFLNKINLDQKQV